MNQDKTPKIRVLIRKRPMNKKELGRNQTDIITVENNQSVVVRQQKLKVDLTPYIDEYRFNFDGAYDQYATNEQIYASSIRPLVDCAFDGAKVSCFAYGQTGSGKTHTMLGNHEQVKGLYLLAASDIFKQLKNFPEIQVMISFYEIYCGKLYDLLNEKNILYAREDAKNNVNIVGLSETKIHSADNLMQIIQYGTGIRVTSQNGTNNDSSRSHAILQISLKKKNKLHGKISFIDLAGSERAADHADQLEKQTRIDGAEINKSLLALKECIRALDQNKNHTPFRGSKLTMVLKDSFTGYCRTVMIGNISPNSSSSQNTLNTLKYADRVKQLKKPNKQSFLQMQKIDQLQKQLMLPRNNLLKKTSKTSSNNLQQDLYQEFRQNINTNIQQQGPNVQNFNKMKLNQGGIDHNINGPNFPMKKANMNGNGFVNNQHQNNSFINNNSNVNNNYRKYDPVQQNPLQRGNNFSNYGGNNNGGQKYNEVKNSPPRNSSGYQNINHRSSSQQPQNNLFNQNNGKQQFLVQQDEPLEARNSFSQRNLQEISEKHDSYVQLILQEEQNLLKHHQEHINSIIQLTKEQMSIKAEADKIGSRIQDYLQNLSKVLDNKLESIFILKQRIEKIKTHLQQSKHLEQQYVQCSRGLHQQQEDNEMLLDDDEGHQQLFIN